MRIAAMDEEDTRPNPSFFQDGHHRAHRGQQLQHQHNGHMHQQLRKRQATTATEVTVTVSYVEQFDVDSSGSTFSVVQLLATPTVSLTDSSSEATTTPATASSGAAPTQPLSATASQSLNSTNTGASSALTSTPSTQSSSFPSFIASSNSSALITSSSSLPVPAVATFSNSSIISTSSSSSSLASSLISSASSTSSLSSSTSNSLSETSSISSLYSPISSSHSPTSTGAGAGVGGTGVASGGTASSTAASGNGSDSSSATTPKVLGGVLGGLAGLALIGFFLLFIIRWYRRKQSMVQLGNGNDGTGNDQVRDAPPAQPGPSMSQRRSIGFAVPAALASLTGYNKRASARTDRTASSTAGSERGFYRVSGRKLPSVLQTGGDGYGGGVHDSTFSGSSFYRDSTGFHGGPGSPPPMSSPLGPERDSGIPVMRPSPARTPVTEHGPFAPSTAPPPPSLTPTLRPDGLGRSHPSQDGSHASRFTEEV